MDTRALLAELRRADPWDLAVALDELPPDVCRALLDGMRDGMFDPDPAPRYDELELLDHQRPPEGDAWTYWLLLGGRGTGKTSGASAEVYRHAMFDPPCIPGVPGGHRMALIAPTLGDASRAVNAPGGLRSLDPDVREVTRKGGTFVEFSNGALLSEYGAHGKDDVERLRAGGNTCRVWCEELVAWRQLGYENDAWDLMRTGLRLGPHPRVVVSTTPKPIPKLRELVDDAEGDDARYALTHGTTFDNPHLSDEYVAELRDLYVGTRLEAQELLGRLLGEVVGALWTELVLRETRWSPDRVPKLERIVVGVDPAFSEEPGSDETGIVVAGRGVVPTSQRTEAFVLDDASGEYGAHSWPAKAVEAYHRHDAYAIVAESNLGGRDFIARSIHAIDPNVNVKAVHAREGKRTRAEPVAGLYERQRAHHVGTFALLEAEQTTWVPGDASPNRLDACVWALTHLSEGMSVATAKASSPVGRRVPSRTSGRR